MKRNSLLLLIFLFVTPSTQTEFAAMGPELQLYTYSTNVIDNPVCAPLPNDNIVHVWSKAYRIYLTIQDEYGEEELEDTQISYSYYNKNYINPEVGVLSDGKILVAWERTRGSYSYYDGFFAELFEEDGEDISTEWAINSDTTYSKWGLEMVVLSNDNILFVWVMTSGIYGAIFDSEGTEVAAQFQISDGSYRNNPAATLMNDGNVIVCWSGYYSYANYYRYCSVIGSDGSVVISETSITESVYSTTHYEMDLITLQNGNVAVVYQYGYYDRVYVTIVDSSNLSTVSTFQVSSSYNTRSLAPKVEAFDSGEFLVVWSEEQNYGSYGLLFGAFYSSTGEKLGTTFQLNEDFGVNVYDLQLVSLDGIDILATWRDSVEHYYSRQIRLEDTSTCDQSAANNYASANTNMGIESVISYTNYTSADQSSEVVIKVLFNPSPHEIYSLSVSATIEDNLLPKTNELYPNGDGTWSYAQLYKMSAGDLDSYDCEFSSENSNIRQCQVELTFTNCGSTELESYQFELSYHYDADNYNPHAAVAINKTFLSTEQPLFYLEGAPIDTVDRGERITLYLTSTQNLTVGDEFYPNITSLVIYDPSGSVEILASSEEITTDSTTTIGSSWENGTLEISYEASGSNRVIFAVIGNYGWQTDESDAIGGNDIFLATVSYEMESSNSDCYYDCDSGSDVIHSIFLIFISIILPICCVCCCIGALYFWCCHNKCNSSSSSSSPVVRREPIQTESTVSVTEITGVRVRATADGRIVGEKERIFVIAQA